MTENNNNSYADIIDLPRPVSKVHPPMPAAERAAQFSPFAALTGFEDAIKETGRLTDKRAEPGEDAGELLDEKLQMLLERPKEQREAEITYFQPDNKKEGGNYITVKGYVKKADIYERKLIMEDGTRIDVGEIVDISYNISE